MKQQTVQFVSASEVFKDCRGAYELFADSEPDCSWGDNEVTLVKAVLIKEQLEEAMDDDELDDVYVKQCEVVIARIESLDCYIDLES